MFAKQAPTGETFYFKPAKANEGDVYVLAPKYFEKDQPGNYGPKDVGIAEAHVFANGKGEPTHYENFQTEATFLAGAIGRGIGGAPLLVTLGQGVARPGKNAPWLWVDADPADYPEIVAFFEGKDAEEAPPEI